MDKPPASVWGIMLIAMGIAARVALAFISWGSNDATTWLQFGKHIHDDGILWLYHHNKDFNHPPLPGYWADLVYSITRTPADPAQRHLGFTFPFVFKLPDILADAIVCWLLWKILSPRRGAVFAISAAAIFAWSPDSILITGHHCNTDPVYVMLLLLSLWLIEDRGKDFLGGLALAAAINVKLIPVLMIVPLLVTYHNWKRAIRFIAGLSIGVIPFIPVLLLEGRAFYHRAIAYNSQPTYWGISDFLLETINEEHIRHSSDLRPNPFLQKVEIIGREYFDKARWIILASVLLMSLRGRETRRYNAYTLAACAGALFLILTPGFGLQYTVLVLPLLFATGRLVAATVYGLLAGVFLFFSYWVNWNGTLPIDTWGLGASRAPGPLYGLLAWATLIVFVFHELRDPRQRDARMR